MKFRVLSLFILTGVVIVSGPVFARMQDFEHDGTSERFLDGEIRGRHPAFSDRVSNAVTLICTAAIISIKRPLVC
jgi:hypothetical protein